VGYVVINGYFANWGANDPGLVSVQYVGAGMCFFIVSGVTVFVLYQVWFTEKFLGRSLRPSHRAIAALAGVVLGALALLLLVGVGGVDEWDHFWPAFKGSLHPLWERQPWSVALAYLVLLPIPVQLRVTLARWRGGNRMSCVLPICITFILTLFGARFFGYQIFPNISSVYGGGRGVDVHLVMERKDAEVLEGLGITFTQDPTVSDKVALVWESEKSVIVVVHDDPPDPADPEKNHPLFGHGSTYRRIVQVERGAVKGIQPHNFSGR
jgi:hypothetical protein